MLPDALLEILCCPKTKHPLVYFPRGETNESEGEAFLLCPAAGLRYRVEAGVPVLLSEEASQVDSRTVASLLSRARELGLSVPA